jgi:hypothetical protein
MRQTLRLMAPQSRRSSFAAIAVAGLAWLSIGSACLAQANRGSTSTGMFGSTTLGSTSGSSPQGFGSGMTMGMGGSNQGGGGQGGQAQGGLSNTNSMMMEGGGPQQLQRGGQSGFVGGSSATAAQNPFASGQRGASSQSFAMLSQLMTRSRQNQFNAQQAQKAGRLTTQAQSQFRVPLRLGFPPATINGGVGPLRNLERGLARAPGLSTFGPINASLENTTAVLRGRVATEADRQLAEGLALLEPGVVAVRNELVVAPAGASTGEALPSPLGGPVNSVP